LEALGHLFEQSPMLALFAVIGLGYAPGQVSCHRGLRGRFAACRVVVAGPHGRLNRHPDVQTFDRLLLFCAQPHSPADEPGTKVVGRSGSS